MLYYIEKISNDEVVQCFSKERKLWEHIISRRDRLHTRKFYPIMLTMRREEKIDVELV